MNITELLLQKDKSSLIRKKKTKQLYSSSLSELLGEEVFIKIKEIENDLFFEFSQRLNDEDDNYSAKDFACDMCVAGIIEPNFRNEEIYSKFSGAYTPEEAIDIAFSAAEQVNILTELSSLIEVSPKKEDVEKVKN